MSGKGLYSAAHDASLHPKASSRKKRSSRAASKPPTGSPPPIFAPGQQLQPTEEQRKELRRRQMGEQVEAALRDRDLIPDVRREYEIDGTVYHSEPRQRPPHQYGVTPGDRRLITLPDDPDTELTEDEQLLRLQELNRQQMVGGVVAAGPALNQVGHLIQQLNDDMDALMAAIRKVQGANNGSQATQHHTEQMQLILSSALKPWLKELDDHAAGIVEDTDMEAQNQMPPDDDDHPLEMEGIQ